MNQATLKNHTLPSLRTSLFLKPHCPQAGPLPVHIHATTAASLHNSTFTLCSLRCSLCLWISAQNYILAFSWEFSDSNAIYIYFGNYYIKLIWRPCNQETYFDFDKNISLNWIRKLFLIALLSQIVKKMMRYIYYRARSRRQSLFLQTDHLLFFCMCSVRPSAGVDITDFPVSRCWPCCLWLRVMFMIKTIYNKKYERRKSVSYWK